MKCYCKFESFAVDCENVRHFLNGPETKGVTLLLISVRLVRCVVWHVLHFKQTTDLSVISSVSVPFTISIRL